MRGADLGGRHPRCGCPCCAWGDRLCVSVGAGGPGSWKADGAPPARILPPPLQGSPEGLPLAVSRVSWEWALLHREMLFLTMKNSTFCCFYKP